MKVLSTADWHLGQFKGPQEDGVNLRFKDNVNCLDRMLDRARVERPDLVCISGDIFDREQVGPNRFSDEILEAVRIIKGLAECSTFVIVMRGTPNHDGNGIFRVLKEWLTDIPNVKVVTTPEVVEIPAYADVACIPGFSKQEFRAQYPGLSAEEENKVWTEHISNIVMGLKTFCHEGRPSILMAHYTVPGCNMESGQTSFFTNFEPVIPREALDAADYSAVFLGHIHRPQRLIGLKNVFYSGAINSLNFNDEGQERGYFLHEFKGNELFASTFVESPYRRFKTIKWDEMDVADYCSEGKLFLMQMEDAEDINDAIVRVQYSCTEEQKRIINRRTLEPDLYDMGAFYVMSVEAETVIEFNNRGLLSQEADPLPNLKKWLEEKEYPDPGKIVELAEPVIEKALAQAATSEARGTFRPVSIHVENYRNYKDETFEFGDISFCTINGQNGAGKSSLFMDAIVDCLYEETREGDLVSWISGDPDVKKGIIEFIFDIGDQRFRVVRTRSKPTGSSTSGKGTLNFSQLGDDGIWINLAGERTRQVQENIERVLGMDSTTFKSCALIMQDQYGLFLQARREDRIAILSKLLGLDIYDAMSHETINLLKETKKNVAAGKNAVKTKEDFIRQKGSPMEELAETEDAISSLEHSMQVLQAKQDEMGEQIREAEQIQKSIAEYSEAWDGLKKELKSNHEHKDKAQAIIDDCNKYLDKEPVLTLKAAEYEQAEKRKSMLEPDVSEYQSYSQRLEEYLSQISEMEAAIEEAEREKEKLIAKLAAIDTIDPETVREGLRKLSEAREQLDMALKKKTEIHYLTEHVNQDILSIQTRLSQAETRKTLLEKELQACREQESFMNDSGCISVSEASCMFLKKAKQDVGRIEDIEVDLAHAMGEVKGLKDNIEIARTALSEQVGKIGYSPKSEQKARDDIKEYEKYQEMADEEQRNRAAVMALESDRKFQDKVIASKQEDLRMAKSRAQEVNAKVQSLIHTVDSYERYKKVMEENRHYLTELQELPVYRERKKNCLTMIEGAESRISELMVKMDSIEGTLQLLKAKPAALPAHLEDLKKAQEEGLAEIEIVRKSVSDLHVQKGTLLQTVADVEQLEAEIKELKKNITVDAAKLTRYDILKAAFSQYGVPHQIIRSVIPFITDTANNILGSMTGGTMGVTFELDKDDKNGEKPILDVKVNEYGKSQLPYASKSGGEKVKAALAVILALAEIKSSSAGIQLGMLFIDEPPFLDDDGTQAYVDSLEAIHDRYPDTKIMAITHDESFKARFPQSVTVVKTSEGSKVIY